jgi:hypothetical protein
MSHNITFATLNIDFKPLTHLSQIQTAFPSFVFIILYSFLSGTLLSLLRSPGMSTGHYYICQPRWLVFSFQSSLLAYLALASLSGKKGNKGDRWQR